MLVAALTWVLAATPANHSQVFWKDVIAHGAVPKGESVGALADELSGMLASEDPKVRDETAYTLLEDWIYSKKLLGPDELRKLASVWTANLKDHVGDEGTNSVLKRSFSALSLSVVVARDNATPFFTREEFDALLNAALQYLKAEKDLRGYDAKLGWVHATAHTADLLKFLGRSRFLSPEGQGKICDAIGAKLAVGKLYAFGEEERLARASLSVLRRADFSLDALTPSLNAMVKAHEKVTKMMAVDPALLASDGAIKGYVRSLYGFATLSDKEHAVGTAAQRALADTLKAIAPP